MKSTSTVTSESTFNSYSNVTWIQILSIAVVLLVTTLFINKTSKQPKIPHPRPYHHAVLLKCIHQLFRYLAKRNGAKTQASLTKLVNVTKILDAYHKISKNSVIAW